MVTGPLDDFQERRAAKRRATSKVLEDRAEKDALYNEMHKLLKKQCKGARGEELRQCKEQKQELNRVFEKRFRDDLATHFGHSKSGD